MTRLPRIAITMGDPAGVGPEVCLRALHSDALRGQCVPILFGDAELLARVARHCGLGDLPPRIDPETWQSAGGLVAHPAVLDLGALDARSVEPGMANAQTGRASFQYIEAAIAAALAGEVDAVATGPIHKEAWHAAGVTYPGHTEVFAARTQTARYCMLLTSDEISCALVTTHVGYRDVPSLLSIERVLETLELSHQAMQRLRGRTPRLAVCGLNPHAGEHGLFGAGEEQHVIVPALEAARAKGLLVEGPLSPDTAFLPARRRATYVCMYHDQGLIPLKTLAFDEAVNVTLGLPIVRTSVDHGTGLDIAWQGIASPTSMVQAVLLAARLART